MIIISLKRIRREANFHFNLKYPLDKVDHIFIFFRGNTDYFHDYCTITD